MFSLANELSVEIIKGLYFKLNKTQQHENADVIKPGELIMLKNELEVVLHDECMYAQEVEAIKIFIKRRLKQKCSLDLNFLLQYPSSKIDPRAKYTLNDLKESIRKSEAFGYKKINDSDVIKFFTTFRTLNELKDTVDYLMVQHKLRTQSFVPPEYPGYEPN